MCACVICIKMSVLISAGVMQLTKTLLVESSFQGDLVNSTTLAIQCFACFWVSFVTMNKLPGSASVP